MRETVEYIEKLIARYPQLEESKYDMQAAYELMRQCFEKGNKLLVAGNGGSAADSEHICGELMKGFRYKRPVDAELKKLMKSIDPVIGEKMSEQLQEPLTVIPLVSHVALMTAYGNDVGSEFVYAQQLLGYGKRGDVFLAISTSGNSKNVVSAVVLAKAMGLHVIGLTGKSGGNLCRYADVTVKVPETEAYLVQELHLPVYHCWCMMLEESFWG